MVTKKEEENSFVKKSLYKKIWFLIFCFLVIFWWVFYCLKSWLFVQNYVEHEDVNQIENIESDILSQYLHEQFIDEARTYNIPDDFVFNHPDVVELILWSNSLFTHKEKQEWFDLYLQMTGNQIDDLKDILVKENESFKKIDEKYWTKYANYVVEY